MTAVAEPAEHRVFERLERVRGALVGVRFRGRAGGLALVAIVLLAGGCGTSADTPTGTAAPAPQLTTGPRPTGDEPADSFAPPPPDAGFDYQLGADYPVAHDVGVIARDWFEGRPATGKYNICYVNAFQTQPDDPELDRPDETSNWPTDLVLTALDQDPNWTGEYLIDISTSARRAAAVAWLAPMIDTCAQHGFDAVEFDNLDSWIRFEDTPSVQGRVPFGQEEAVAFATQLTAHAHGAGLAVGQKNTLAMIESGDHDRIGFDFAIVEQCGEFDECGGYTAGYDDHVLVIEYTDNGFARACAGFSRDVSIVRRDLALVTPDDDGYVFDIC